MRFCNFYICLLPKILIINIVVIALLVSSVGAETIPEVAQNQIFTSSSQTTSLIELYSSQGCSSCPPAQAYINELGESEGLWKNFIPLVFHVDYWDYLGWKDPYSSATYSERQREHANKGNIYSVYTPGFVVDGREWRGFFARKSAKKAFKSRLPGILKVKLSRFSGQLVVNTLFEAEELSLARIGNINIAVLGLNLSTHVHKGENAGRKLKESFIVLHHLQEKFVAEKNISIADTFSQKDLAIAVWLTDLDGLSPVQAAGGIINK